MRVIEEREERAVSPDFAAGHYWPGRYPKPDLHLLEKWRTLTRRWLAQIAHACCWPMGALLAFT